MFRGFCFKHIWSCGFLFKEENPFKYIKELWKKIQYVDNLCAGKETRKIICIVTHTFPSGRWGFWWRTRAVCNTKCLWSNLTRSLYLQHDLTHSAIANPVLQDTSSGKWPLNKVGVFLLLCPGEVSQEQEAEGKTFQEIRSHLTQVFGKNCLKIQFPSHWSGCPEGKTEDCLCWSYRGPCKGADKVKSTLWKGSPTVTFLTEKHGS